MSQADRTGHEDPREECQWSRKTDGGSSALSQEEALQMQSLRSDSCMEKTYM